ncbi:cysteine-rich repeat secretory protein 55-like [Populus alba]|uniref:cysteine-rich repeat secretory protein 55-like n=1 Tax=Populus alba TaxID=43335 RepID=UPI003CC7328D
MDAAAAAASNGGEQIDDWLGKPEEERDEGAAGKNEKISKMGPCHADSNSNLGSLCSEADNATNSSEYQANLSELQNSLVANAPIQNGFYTTAAGKGANKIYGLTQCRGDISATDCAACIKNVTMVHGCSNSKNATLWFKWCFVRYSDRRIFGESDQSGMATYNETNFEDAKVVF